MYITLLHIAIKSYISPIATCIASLALQHLHSQLKPHCQYYNYVLIMFSINFIS